MTGSRPLAVITTELPPGHCGIGTYSWLLRKHWPNELSAVEFLVRKGDATATELNDRVTSFHGERMRLAAELQRLGAADVLLHYTGRAYHRFGCPLWMPGVLAKWKHNFPEGRLILFVHEVPPHLPPNSPHFCLGKLSAWVLRRVAACADLLITNTENHRRELRKIASRNDVHLLPIASNIEPTAPPRPRARGEFLVFGLPFGRLQTLRLFENHIPRWQAEGQLTRLHIIGPRDEKFSPQAVEITRGWEKFVLHHGALPATEVSRLLRSVQFALTNVSETTWNQATVFLACAAHECPIVIASRRAAFAPLSSAVGVDEVERISEAELAERSASLLRWYHANADWPVIGQRMAKLLAS